MSDEYKPSELLEILRKVWPEAYGHVVWQIRTLLRLRQDVMPPQKHKGCSGETPTQRILTKGGEL